MRSVETRAFEKQMQVNYDKEEVTNVGVEWVMVLLGSSRDFIEGE